MYIIETLPRAGTEIAYRFGTGVWHRAVIDTGIVMTICGIHRQLPVLRNYHSYLKFADPNKDSFQLWATFAGKKDNQGRYIIPDGVCGRCVPTV